MSQSIDIGQLQAQLELNRSSLADSILSKLSHAKKVQPQIPPSIHTPRPANLGVGAKPKQTNNGKPNTLADARLKGALTAKRKDRDTLVQAAADSDDDDELGRAASISRKKAKSGSIQAQSSKPKDPFASKGALVQKAAQAPTSNIVTIDGETIDLSQLSKTQRKKMNKRIKQSQSTSADAPSANPVPQAKQPVPPSTEKTDGQALTPLQAQMLSKLSGSRFRTINEKLYTTHSREAMQMIEDSPSTFDEYHQGFREQVRSWPKNPLDRIVEMLDPATASSASKAGKSKSASTSDKTLSKITGKAKARFSPSPLVVDLGAGEGGLAKKLVPKGLKVLSFDLLSTSDGWVKRQDSAAIGGLPLPGYMDVKDPLDAEKTVTQQAPGIVDVAVFCLSLMGTNWVHMILEAKRILRTG